MTSAVVLVATVLTVALALGRSGDGADAGDDRSPISALVNPTATNAATVAAVTQTPYATVTAPATAVPSTEAPATTEPTATATPQPTASSVTATPAIGEPATATPFVSTPGPVATVAPNAADLVAEIEAEYGVHIVVEGQDWGAGPDDQLRNIGAAGKALAGLPDNARNAITEGGSLTILSNHRGATAAGWQPYGERESNYYTNEDVVNGKHVAASQIVLQPGSTAQTITHELMHAYQMRGIAPGEYVQALLTPEMKSFMRATGWTQNVSDDQLRAASGDNWDAINGMFSYNGRSLSYGNESGARFSLFTPNPVEAFAEAGGLYYGHDANLMLPDWPEYWAWFDANVG